MFEEDNLSQNAGIARQMSLHAFTGAIKTITYYCIHIFVYVYVYVYVRVRVCA